MIGSKAIDSIEGALRFFLDSVGNNIDNVVEIDTALNTKTFVTKDGSLVSLVEILGNTVEDNDFRSIKARTNAISKKVESYLSNGSHELHFAFKNEVGTGSELVEESQSRAREVSKAVGFNLEELFDSQTKAISKQITKERVVLAVWTSPKALEEAPEESDDIKEYSILDESSQPLGVKYNDLFIKHNEFAKDVCSALNNFGCNLKVLDRHTALSFMARMFQEFVPEDSKFIFPDTEYTAKGANVEGIQKGKDSYYLWPSISEQIVKQDELEEDISRNILEVDDMKFSTFEVKIPPRDLVVFNDLADSINNLEVPYLISFKIKSDMGFNLFWKKALSHIPFPASNGRLKNSISAVNSLAMIGHKNVDYKISVCTWSEDTKQLLSQKNHLKTKVTSWGNSQVRNFKGSPLKALVQSIPGISKSVFGCTSYAPVLGVLPQLPLSRRGRIWDKSSLSFVTEDGNLFPYLPTSNKEQNFWNIGVMATMGSGKSVLLQCIALSHILNHIKNGVIPFVGYLDIGFSVQRMMELLRSMLPSEMKDNFIHLTMQNHKDFAYNIHDTPLGCRHPDIDQRNFMAGFYLTLLTPATQEKPHPDLDGIIKQALIDAYKYRSDDEKPKEYSRGKNKRLDEILEPYGITSTVSYWDIVDLLFDNGDIKGAKLAQRYAVPTIDDIVAQLNMSPNITKNYKDVTVGEGSRELLTDYAIRQITLAVESYPVIAHPTNIDVDEGRFIVLDLNNVAKGGDTAAAKKETAVFYTLGRFIVTRNFFVTESIYKYTPPRYLKYHQERVPILRSTPKLTVYDEFHRVGYLSSFKDMILTEMREARKWSLSVLMASQLLRDFDSTFTNLMGSLFVMSNNAGTVEDVKEKFTFNNYLSEYYSSQLTGPNKEKGTPFIAKFNLKTTTITQSLRFVLSPFQYWLTTSDAVDNEVYNALTQKMPNRDVLKIMLEKHPMGIKDYVYTLSTESPEASIRKDPIGHIVRTYSKAA
ncbi:hypothetical protein [Vibrio sp. D431a]|uniref:hypothetical protein n=1 Tax=Vibrio sp. D431a TaxID=2837388 RepID=UPI002556A6EE|nr:hypothetical protein [Vibrio sp. D431a]MDK9793820.1 hypothetical protein [Vibrio sp. D431a]